MANPFKEVDEQEKNADGTLAEAENSLTPVREEPLKVGQENKSFSEAVFSANESFTEGLNSQFVNQAELAEEKRFERDSISDRVKAKSQGQELKSLDITTTYGAQEVLGPDNTPGNEGGVKIINSDGEPETVFPEDDLIEQNFDPTKINIRVNSPESPVEEVPPSINAAEGFTQGLGTTSGLVEQLEKSFEGVEVNKNGEIVVLDGNTWYTLNPDWAGSGNPYQMSRAIVQDISSFASSEGPIVGGIIVGSAVLATAATGGLAAPSIPAAMAAAGVGGASGAFIRNSMGRVAGTFKATPEQEAFDLGMTGLFAAGGEGLILGAKAAYPIIKGKLGNASSKIAEAAEPVYNALTEFYGGLTGAGTQATRTMVNSRGGTTALIKELENSVGKSNVSGIQTLARDKAIGAADNLLFEAERALPVLYGRNLERVAAQADTRALEANIPEMLREVQNSFVEAGLGTFERSSSNISVSFAQKKIEAKHAVQEMVEEVLELQTKLRTTSAKNKILAKQSPIFKSGLVKSDEKLLASQLEDKARQLRILRAQAAKITPKTINAGVIEGVEFRQLNPEEIAKRMQPVTGDPLPVKILSDATFAQVKGLANTIQNFSRLKASQGGNAVELMNTVNSQLNSILRGVDRAASPAEWQAMSNATKSFRMSVDRTMEKAGLKESWGQLSESYKTFGDSVATARKLRNSDNGVEGFLSHIVDKSPIAHRSQKRAADKMVELVNAIKAGEGSELADVVSNMFAAEKFAPLAPHWSAAGARAEVTVTAGIFGGAALGGPLGSAAAAGALSQSSPALVRKQMSAGWKVLEFLQRAGTIGESGIDAVLSDPNYIRAMVAELSVSEQNSAELEQAIVETKLQKAAAKKQLQISMEQEALRIQSEIALKEAGKSKDKGGKK